LFCWGIGVVDDDNGNDVFDLVIAVNCCYCSKLLLLLLLLLLLFVLFLKSYRKYKAAFQKLRIVRASDVMMQTRSSCFRVEVLK